MKRKFEEYFPLPWKTTKEKDVVFIKGQGWNIPVIIAEGSVAECAEREALRYAVQCANLMPECAEALKQAKKELADICEWCNTCPSNGRKLCETGSVIENITALLAKLEGGADK